MRQCTTCQVAYTHSGRHLPDAVECKVPVHKVAQTCFTWLSKQFVTSWRALMGVYKWDGVFQNYLLFSVVFYMMYVGSML
jgi:hypothetical protein